jgi:hypothetical protein
VREKLWIGPRHLRSFDAKVSIEIAIPFTNPMLEEELKMDLLEDSNGLVRDPLSWAAECSTHAVAETEPEARDAYVQLAQEFESVSTEIEGLISTFEALMKRKRNV